MAWQQQNYSGDQGYGHGQQQQYVQQFNQQYGSNAQSQQGYNQGNQNWKTGPANMDAGPGHFGMSNSVSFSEFQIEVDLKSCSRIQTTATAHRGITAMEEALCRNVAEHHVQWAKTILRRKIQTSR